MSFLARSKCLHSVRTFRRQHTKCTSDLLKNNTTNLTHAMMIRKNKETNSQDPERLSTAAASRRLKLLPFVRNWSLRRSNSAAPPIAASSLSAPSTTASQTAQPQSEAAHHVFETLPVAQPEPDLSGSTDSSTSEPIAVSTCTLAAHVTNAVDILPVPEIEQRERTIRLLCSYSSLYSLIDVSEPKAHDEASNRHLLNILDADDPDSAVIIEELFDLWMQSSPQISSSGLQPNGSQIDSCNNARDRTSVSDSIEIVSIHGESPQKDFRDDDILLQS